MFYNAETDFFYDPTSRLYYGNKKRAYYSYSPDTKRFSPVGGGGGGGDNNNKMSADGKEGPSETDVPPPPAGTDAAEDPSNQDHFLLVPTGADNKTAVEPPKKVIAIKLKTAVPVRSKNPEKKKKKHSESSMKTATAATAPEDSSGKATPATATPVLPNILQKQHAVNIEKWHERGKELKQEATAAESAAKATALKKTADGKPICWLCKRKFPTLEKLKQHEEKSALHKENVAKLQQQEEEERKKKEAEEKDATAAYLDRAQQRRDLYGPEHVLPPPLDPSAAAQAALAPPTDADNVNSDPLDSSTNIGHQMLQKMGWQSGKSLGGRSDGGIGGEEQQTALAQDWDRIENMVAKPQMSSRKY
jgi:RNA-binding protein 5/10